MGGNGGCIYYIHRGNSAFQHADKSVWAIFDKSEHFKLTLVISVSNIALFLCLLDYYTLTIRFCF